jgi:hypothetical protein
MQQAGEVGNTTRCLTEVKPKLVLNIFFNIPLRALKIRRGNSQRMSNQRLLITLHVRIKSA